MTRISAKVPQLPSRKHFRIFFSTLFLGCSGALFIPFSLSLNFSGKISPDGPTNEITAPSDSIISSIANENVLLKHKDILVKFSRPEFKADTEIMNARLKSINSQEQIASNECTKVTRALNENLKSAKEVYDLNLEAFQLNVISELKLLTAKSDLNNLESEIAIHLQKCSENNNKLVGEKEVIVKELEKLFALNKLTQSITAPADGYLHRVSVKPGQLVTSGQTIGSFTSEKTAGAALIIPLRDRPYVKVGDSYLITSEAYQILSDPPIRECTISAISPDSFIDNASRNADPQNLSFEAECRFKASPIAGDYPFLVGMSINASATSVKASLIQILLEGYRRLLVNQKRLGEKS